MAFLECQFHSDVLGRACGMNVILPQQARTQIGMGSSSGAGKNGFPVLYLLHGLSDNHTIWSRRTSIERHVADYGIAVVMPDGGRGFYTDAHAGERWWTFLSEELPSIVAGLFPISTRREETWAAGLSMGGYGALKLALRRPDRFAGAAGLSSVADIRHWLGLCDAQKTPGVDAEMNRIFGSPDDLAVDGNDLFALAEQAMKAPQVPRLWMACGTEDFLYDDNRALRDHLRQLNWPEFHYEEGPGSHTWEFWDARIQHVLRDFFGTLNQ